MGWFGFNKNTNTNNNHDTPQFPRDEDAKDMFHLYQADHLSEKYDKNGNPQPRFREIRRINDTFGTADLDHILRVFAPDFTKLLNAIFAKEEAMKKTIDIQNQKIDELNRKLDLLVQKSELEKEYKNVI